jgi:RHS repeat-associated protein
VRHWDEWPATQTFGYDLDGNLTNDSIWALKWDSENRLVQATNLTTVTSTARKKLVFAYDNEGRRIRKTVYNWASTDYATTPSEDLLFVHDGWNLLAELNQTNKTVLRSYVWGKDLGGDLDSAGGIGGLLMQRDHTGGGSHHFAGYDGNGNVSVLVKSSDSTVSATYEHGPFGEAIRLTGTQAKANPFRWSTKFTDDQTDLVYYGYRYYSASLGRWINRDPIEEDGGINMYAFVLNHPGGDVDPLGMNSLAEEESAAGIQGGMASQGSGSATSILRQVREWADTFNDVQELIVAVMDSSEGDNDDLFISLLGSANNAAALGVRKGKWKAPDFEKHHPYAREFADQWKRAGIKWEELTKKISYNLHRKVIHAGKGKGGWWNSTLRKFFEERRSAAEMVEKVDEMMKKTGIDKQPWD